MLSQVFAAYLSDVWTDQGRIPPEDQYLLSVLAKRISLWEALKRRSFVKHQHWQNFVRHLQHALNNPNTKTTPTLSAALHKVNLVCQHNSQARWLWQKELAVLAKSTQQSIAYTQSANSPTLTKVSFGQLSRPYSHLLGGSRTFTAGQLHDESWQGRVHAFVQRLSL
jgi:hypothetical protein